MPYPEWMTSQRRWLVRPINDGSESKQPRSPLRECPEGYLPKRNRDGEIAEGSGTWKLRWDQQCICASYEEAAEYLERNQSWCDGLSFVLHPFGQVELSRRLVCLDYDRAFAPDGNLWPWLREIVDSLDGYAFIEYSRSKKGIHVFILTDCEAFDKFKVKDIEGTGCALDGLCAAQVAVTGNVFEDYSSLEVLPYSFLSSQSWWRHKAKSTTPDDAKIDYQAEWWDQSYEPRELDPALLETMKSWPVAVKGEGRSDTSLAAACVILCEGIVGHEAVEYLRHIRTDQPFTEKELQHKIESAHAKTISTGTFNNKNADEFDVVDDGTPKAPEATLPEGTPGVMFEGIHFLTLAELDRYDVELKWLVKQVAIDCPTQTLCFGGREKTFKTSVMCDFAISLATGKPFLGHFEVVSQKRTLFLTAEIGIPAARSLARRVREHKGVESGTVDSLIISSWLPNFSAAPELKKLDKVLKHFKPEAVAFDPFYFGAADAEVGDMYKMVKMLRPLTKVCMDNGAMPIIAHHANRSKADQFVPMSLGELYGAGFQAYVRQWILLSHAEPMREGKAALWFSVGGSSFRSPDHKLFIDEGESDADKVDTRRWNVRVEKVDSAQAAVNVERKVLETLCDMELSKKEIYDLLSSVSKDQIDDALIRLRDQSAVTYQGGKYKKLAGDEFTNN